jgi:flavin reductase (DIM6/NTAB) family NADH-FMN oxidoreductase RutF
VGSVGSSPPVADGLVVCVGSNDGNLDAFDLAPRTLQAVRHSGRFAVSFLSPDQEALSRRFAGKLPAGEKFADVPYEVVLGMPVIAGASAWLVCRTRSFDEAATT